nr:MAG TPA: hypothetical protein [Caudoviricetes sp.]
MASRLAINIYISLHRVNNLTLVQCLTQETNQLRMTAG